MTRKPWHLRGLTSLFTTAGFLVMSLTGIVAYIMPQGRIAYWSDWRLLGLTKTQWGDIHIISSLLFVVAGAFHIYFNWKPLWNYLVDKAKGGVKLKREIALSLVVAALVVVAGIRPFPPFSLLIDLNGYLKDSWVKSPAYEPPFGHAEDLSLKVFCSKTGIDLQKALAVLETEGIKGVDPQRKLIEIARDHSTSPMAVYASLKRLEPKLKVSPGTTFTLEKVEDQFGGTGIGNKTIAEVAEMTGHDEKKIQERLEQAGISMTPDQSIKTGADANGLSTPLELLKIMLVEGYQPPR